MAKRRHRRHAARRSNPISIKRFMTNPKGLLTPVLAGAVGAGGINAIINYVPHIPDALKTGNALHLTKAALALLLGTFGGKIPVLGKHATEAAKGALTVVTLDVLRQLATKYGYNLNGTGFISPASIMGQNVRALPRPGTGQYVNGVRGVGMYVQGRR